MFLIPSWDERIDGLKLDIFSLFYNMGSVCPEVMGHWVRNFSRNVVDTRSFSSPFLLLHYVLLKSTGMHDPAFPRYLRQFPGEQDGGQNLPCNVPDFFDCSGAVAPAAAKKSLTYKPQVPPSSRIILFWKPHLLTFNSVQKNIRPLFCT